MKRRFMLRQVIGLLVILAGWASVAHSESLSLTGYVRNYSGVLLEGGDFAVIQNTVDLTIEHYRERVAFKVNPYLYHLPSKFTDINNELEFGLRQAYMDIYFDSMDLRIGKQQIVWGKGDGVFITDVVSPKDLREFLLPDFEEIRIGVTSLKTDYYLGDHTFEAVWIPVFTPTSKPEEGSLWKVAPTFLIPPDMDVSKEDVEATLGNSEFFAKYSMLGSRVDFEVMGGYAWDDDPIMHTTKVFRPGTRQLESLIVTPQHHRLTLGGGSFSTTLGGFVIRGEGAYYSGKYFQSTDPQLPEGVLQKDYLHYLVGVDYTLWGATLSAQFIQKTILGYDDQIVNDQCENTMTILLSKGFLRETLRVELFSYIGLNEPDALIRPKVYYDLTDGFEILGGANIFLGDDGSFGQYTDNNMMYAKLKYSF